MHKIKATIFKAITLMAFTGLVIAGNTRMCSANSGNGGQDYRDSTDTYQGTGSGTGGSDTGTTDTGSSYSNEEKGNPTDSSGSGSGGSTDTETYTSPSNYNHGTGPNYGTAPLGGPSGDGMGDPGPVKR